MTYKSLRTAALLFLLLPVLLFLLFFVKPFIGIPAAVGLSLVYILAIREKTNASQAFEIPLRRLIVFFAICAVWCYLGGQGGFFYQTSDWNERNAIFRDLITNKWPVYYPVTDTMLTYYIGHWLPAASLGRIIYLATQNVDLAFSIGNVLMGFWTLFGIYMTLLLHICTAHPKSARGQWLIMLLMVGFSGMDIIGCRIMNWTKADIIRIQHIEWWIDRYQFSSNTTCLFWVFNQAVPAWVATLCFINEKNNRNYALIIGCTLLSASLPCVGLAILMIGKVVFDAIAAAKKKKLWLYIKRTFSISNILTVVCWIPIIGAYLLSNSAFNTTIEGGSEKAAVQIADHMRFLSWIIIEVAIVVILLHFICRFVFKAKKTPFFLGSAMLLIVAVAMLYLFPDTGRLYFVFLALECGIYWLLLANNYHRSPLYYLIGLLFLISPCIKVGIGADFCMRASLPALVILMSMCGEKLCRWIERRSSKKRSVWSTVSCILLTLCLIIGLATPVIEVHRGIINVSQAENNEELTADSIYTLNQYHSSGGIYGNFVSDSYSDSIFFKYFARKS